MKHLLWLICIHLVHYSHSQNYEIYVSDAGNFSQPPWQILKFDQNGQNPVVFINTNLNWPQDVHFMEDSNLVLVSNLGNGKICRHHAATGTWLSDFATGIGGPTRMKLGQDGYLYVLQWSGNGKVRRYEMNGSFVDEFTSVGVPQSIGLDWDSNGYLYVSSYTGGTVRKFDSNGNDMGLHISSNLLGPTNIWFDASGDLLVADYNGTSVKRFDSNGLFLGNYITGLSQSEGIDYLPDGTILIGNGGTNSVKRFDAAGNYIQDFIAPNSGNLLNPNAVVVRTLSGSGIPETEATFDFLYPTIGTEFYLSPSLSQPAGKLRIYSLTGMLINSYTVTGKQTVILRDLADGLYLAALSLNDSHTVFQKIIVQH